MTFFFGGGGSYDIKLSERNTIKPNKELGLLQNRSVDSI